MQTGKKIKLLRAIKGLSQEQLADKIGRTRALISHVEQTGKVNYDTLTLILKVLSISKQEFDDFEQDNLKLNATKEYQSVTKEMQTLQDRLESCQKENTILKELVETQKDLIAMLKQRATKKPTNSKGVK